MLKRIEIKIYGRVQGVFFRSFVREAALELGLTGFVRNEPDGSVLVIAEGAEEKLQELISRCRKGPLAARVDKVEVEWQEATGEHQGFRIRI